MKALLRMNESIGAPYSDLDPKVELSQTFNNTLMMVFYDNDHAYPILFTLSDDEFRITFRDKHISIMRDPTPEEDCKFCRLRNIARKFAKEMEETEEYGFYLDEYVSEAYGAALNLSHCPTCDCEEE